MLRKVSCRAVVGRTRVSHRMAVQQSCRIPEASGGPSQPFRSFATSEKKRSLNAQQLKGSSNSTTAPPKTSKIPPPTAEVPTESESKSGVVGPVLALLVATGGAGAAYYNGLLDEYLGGDQKSTVVLGGEQKPTSVVKKSVAEKPKKTKEAKNAEPVTKEAAPKASTPPSRSDESLANAAKEEVALSQKELEELNEIVADVISEATLEVEGIKEAVEAIVEEEKKNAAAAAVTAAAVTAAAAKAAAKASAKAKKKVKKKAKPVKEAEAEAAPVTKEPPIAMMSATVATSSLDESKILAEIEDLKKQLNQRTDSALEEAHIELAKLGKLDIMGIDIDKMTQSQLKVRLVQMARDLEERTKWEAVRLQEFLNMKEKEVEDRYLLLIKKLRLEAGQLQEGKLTEQKRILTSQAEEALKEQQTRSDAFLQNSMQIQEKAHVEDKVSFEKTTKEAMDARYEELLGKELTKIKEDFATKMNQRVRQMEELTKKLAELDTSLKTSKAFQVGSLEAHKITAAAIALMEKLESGDPAGAAVRALEAVAAENAVVSAAVQSLPTSVSLSGVYTIQELQTSFEETIYPQCRKAANIPYGVDGLEGQLLGGVFSFLRFPPGPDEAAPEAEKDAPEYVLARIKRYVQLGELENAVYESKKLEGQVAFTARDWEAKARDRVAVEKALKVIRMECALANEYITQARAA